MCTTNQAGCAYRKGDLWKITNGLGQVTETLAYDGAGRPKSVKDPNGVITDYEYHVRGWLTAVKVRGTNNSAETDDRITRIEYWPTGLVKKVSLPMGAATNYTYDAAHRLTQVSDNAGNKIVYTLDNAGNRIKEEVKNSSGTLKATLSRVYNQLGQLATAADASANPTDFSYDANGNTTGTEDALGRTTSYAFDALNRLKESIQDTAGIQAKTGVKYNALDQVTEVTDPKGLKTTYKYNGFGDLTELKSPDTGTTTYTYDEAGNVKTAKDARGKTATYAYDGLNRVTSIGYASTALNVTYGYDTAGTACASGETFAKGRLSSMTDGAGSTQYCYNRFGDLVRKVQTINGVSLTLRYTYAANGNLTGMVYPDNTVVDYTRDVQGRVTAVGVTRPAASREVVLSQASYHPFGPVAGWTYGNGRTMSRPVDLDYRPLAIVDSAADGLQVAFGYDPVGNLTSLNSATNTTPQLTIGYDALGRLTSLSDPNATQPLEAYTYDATGNRTSAKQNGLTKAYTYASTSHRLTNVGGLARSYAADGSTTALNGTAKQFTYDDTGRMQQAKNGSTVVMNYRYNGRGERTRAYLGSANTYTLYDEAGHWLGDYGNNGTVIQQAIWMEDLPVGVVTTAKTHYLQPDHLGTPRAVIDPASNKAIWSWSIRGEAFGATAPNEDPDQDGQAFVFNLRFPGQRYDAASGLNYNYFRDYEPGTGRYVQSDPIGFAGGISTYGYVSNSPLEYLDALGLQRGIPIRGPTTPGYPGSSGGYYDPNSPYNTGPNGETVYPGMSIPSSADIVAGILTSPLLTSPASPVPTFLSLTKHLSSEMACGEGENCQRRYEEEAARCETWRGRGPRGESERWYYACLSRAANRRNLCTGNGGPTGEEPPEWSGRDLR
ncbi:RHS repeat domain-containing protein [Pseudoxanthomonas composti]|uniref:RHS repeat domain-containing protein n=1 Tax=Pseudoxanthomonas composti TaxID=2137479 RepID=UPI001F505B3A|nr:RHS repeat domain-containing protein [Pseudoxanthomonas composti]